jgi:7-keto-8-aminopelargonate synthetase-like enzyme
LTGFGFAARERDLSAWDLNALEGALRLHESESCRKLIVTESVFSMDGDIADVQALQKLAERYGASLVVDEAHATAVHGPDGSGYCGRGAADTRSVCHRAYMRKSAGECGAFVCGSLTLRNF